MYALPHAILQPHEIIMEKKAKNLMCISQVYI